MSGDNYNNHGNNFGHMGPLNIGRPEFKIDLALQNRIEAALANCDSVAIEALGGQRAWGLGHAIDKRAKELGKSSSLMTIGVEAGALESPFNMTASGRHLSIYINSAFF
ncbi:MAG TPA: hypothetical protein VGN97_09760 [Mesorhizobium sp.]|nr:hypothetical protein [Mesorhizobium sp.]